MTDTFNPAIVLVGVFGTFFVVAFIVCTVQEGWRFAFGIVGSILGIFVATLGVILFWIWVAGGFA